MGVKLDKTVRTLAKAIRDTDSQKTRAYDRVGKVVKVVGKTAWVDFGGGVAETPVSMTISAKKGDSVRVRVAKGNAWITGNVTAPPTDDTSAYETNNELGVLRDYMYSAEFEKGDPGEDGEPGASVVKIEFEYCISEEPELVDGEVDMLTDDWQSNVPTLDDIPLEEDTEVLDASDPDDADEIGQIAEDGYVDLGTPVSQILSFMVNGTAYNDYEIGSNEDSEQVILINLETWPASVSTISITYIEGLDPEITYYIWMRTLTYTTDMEEGDDPEEGVPTIYGTLTAFGSKEFLVKTLVKTEIKYCLATENYIPEGETFEDIQDGYWQIDPPTLTTGKWIWQKTIYYYSDGSIEEEDPVFDAAIQLTFEAAQVAETASDTAATARSIAEAARTGISAIENYFWTDSAGVHVSEAQKSVATGSSMTVASQGIVMMADGHLISSWTKASGSSAAAVNFYDGTNDENVVATYNSSGTSLYVGGNRMMALSASGLSLYQSDGVTVMATYSSAGMNVFSNGALAASFSGSSARIYASGNSYAEMVSGGFNVIQNGSDVLSASNSGLTMKSNSGAAIGSFTSNGLLLSYGNNRVNLGIQSCALTLYSGSVGFGVQVNSSSGETSLSSNGYRCIDLMGPGAHFYGYIWNEMAVTARDTSLNANLHINVTVGSDNYGRIVACAAASSKRYKNSIGPITTDDIDPHRLYDIDVVQFTYNNDYLGNKKDDRYGRPLPGFIAEQIYDVYPIAIDREEGVIETWNERYIIPPMLALIQEQHEQIEALNKRIDILERSN